jgi:hypothetical protein
MEFGVEEYERVMSVPLSVQSSGLKCKPRSSMASEAGRRLRSKRQRRVISPRTKARVERQLVWEM